MICSYEKYIDKFVEGKLSEVQEKEFADHTLYCRECREKLEKINRTNEKIFEALNRDSFSSNIEVIMKKVRERERKKSAFTIMHKYKKQALAAAVLVVFILSVSLYKPVISKVAAPFQKYILKRNSSYIPAKKHKHFSNPDKIIFYNKGKKLEIEKGTELYNKVLDLTEERFKVKLGAIAEAFKTRDLEQPSDEVQELRFVYSEMQKTYYGSRVFNYEKYVRIFMPLSGESNTKAIYDDDSGYCAGPLGGLLPPDELLKLLEESQESSEK